MTARTILQSFDAYRLARMSFVQTVADLALRAQNIDVLLTANTVELLKPLLDDICPQIQQCAAVALGRIAHHSTEIARYVQDPNFLTALLHNLNLRSKYYRRAAMFVLRSVCRHGTQAAESLVSGAGVLEAIMLCMVDLDAQVREAAAWAAGYIARGSEALAKQVVDAGAVPQLVLCLQEPNLSVRRVAASALSDIARHSQELAITVMNSSAIAHLARAVLDRDDGLKRQALMALSSIATDDISAAEAIIQAEIFPETYTLMVHRDPKIRRSAAFLIKNIARHIPETAQYIVNTGGVGALVQSIIDEEVIIKKEMSEDEDYRLPVVSALGYIAGQGSQLAKCIVGLSGVDALICAYKSASIRSELKSCAVWALGQVGCFCPEAVTDTGVLRLLVTTATDPNCPEPLRIRCNTTVRLCVQGCTAMSVLEPLMYEAPPEILKYVVGQFSKILPHDPQARRLFVTSGSLRRLQEISVAPGTQTMEYINIINSCFPEEVVKYYTPGYSDLLLQKVDEYKPNFETEETAAFDEDVPLSRTISKELAILFDD